MRINGWCILSAIGAICGAISLGSDLQTSIGWSIFDLGLILLNGYFTYFYWFEDEDENEKIS